MNWRHQTKSGAFLIMLLLMLTYLGTTAFANFGFAPPPTSDMSRSFLNEIFGGLLDGGTDAFGASIRNFNGAILIVGGILAAYTIFAGTLGTAHDGEVLGKKFSSVWIPIRYVMGTALVLPVLSGGYCIMQGIVMWLIMQGVSMANGVWSEYMRDPPGMRVQTTSAPSPALLKFVEDSYLTQVCLKANQKLKGELSVTSALEFTLAPTLNWGVQTNYRFFGGDVVDPRGKKNYTFGLIDSLQPNAAPLFTCGKISYLFGDSKDHNASSSTTEISNANASTEYNIPSFSNIRESFKSPDYTSVIVAHYDQMDEVIAKTAALADSHLNDYKNLNVNYKEEYEKIYEIAANYNKAVKTAAAAVAQKNTMSEASTANGWFIAGAWITQILIQQNKLNTVVNGSPQVTDLSFGTLNSLRDEDFGRLTTRALTVIAFNNQTAKAYLGKINSEKSKKDDDDDSPGLLSRMFGSLAMPSFSGSIANWLGYMIAGIDLNFIKEDKRHPIIIMSTIGNSILSSVVAALTIVFGLSFVTAFMGSFTGPFISFFGSFAIPISGFIGIAATLAYLLPNLPFLLWIGIIIGWTVMCVEAVLAAPLWAVMHLHPNGDDLTGRGGNGYMLVLGLLLRPTLIIFGLIAAITLSGLFGQFINAVFLDVFLMNQGDSSSGFFLTLFGTGLYAAMMMTVIKQTFNLMHIIPDQLLRWIGGGQEQLGQYAGASTDSMTKASMIGGAAAGVAIQQGSQGIAAAAGQYGKHRQEQKALKEGQEKAANDANSQLGEGAGDMYRSIDAGGGSQLSKTAEKAESANLMRSLPSAEARTSFAQKYTELKKSNPDAPSSAIADKALKHAMDNHVGQGSFAAAQKLSGGSAGDKNGNGGSWGSVKSDKARSISAISQAFNANAQERNADGTSSFSETKGKEAVESIIQMADVATQQKGEDQKSFRSAFTETASSFNKSGGSIGGTDGLEPVDKDGGRL